MKQTKEFFSASFYLLFLAAVIWVAVSTGIQRFKRPELSETELFLRIPKSFICDWK